MGQPHAPPQHTAHLSLVRSIPFPQVHHGTKTKCSYHATPPPPCDTKSCWSTCAHTLFWPLSPPPPRPPWGRVCAALSTSLWLRRITSATPIRGRGPRLNSCPAAPVRIHFWRRQIHTTNAFGHVGQAFPHTHTHPFPCFAHSPPLSHGHPGILEILAPNALGIAVELTAVGWLPSSTTRVPSLDNRRW